MNPPLRPLLLGSGWLLSAIGPGSEGLAGPAAVPASNSAACRSPENQVFQFMHSGIGTNWSDGSSNRATAYLWIPERCQRLQGLLILCANVPEHRLVGHPAIREACAANDLGIVWCVPSFMNFRKNPAQGTDMAREHVTTVRFLQALLDGLAATSGYAELATVPWLPMGESGHLLMVDALVEHAPARCLAGIWIKNNHLPPQNRTVPALVVYGTAQEWGQEKVDVRTNWNQASRSYAAILKARSDNPGWPLSYVIDGGSGHFDCSERLAQYFGRYIDLVAKARLPQAGGVRLKPVELERGFLADLSVPGRASQPVTPFSTAAPAARGLPWYFDRATAEEAQSVAAINWQAETQMPAFADATGRTLPFNFNGISSLIPQMEADGITFTLRGLMLEELPDNFVGAGSKLASTSGQPELEWLCGPITPVSSGKFRVSLDRSWPASACYVAARQAGDGGIRSAVQPCAVKLPQHTNGLPQRIYFDSIPDVVQGTKSLTLSANSSAGLPVRFFVRAGPAEIQGDQLVFTPVPPRSRLPLTVTVGAWQWGRAAAPAVQTAAVVEQQFRILASE